MTFEHLLLENGDSNGEALQRTQKQLKKLWINSAMKLDSLASWLKYNTNSECYAGVDGWEMQ